uniref:Glycosyltransferase family 28 N-terminal domain-containing protein n=1 Tax=Oryza punctata TaxID=4537 RepID=A0A0E0KKE3_ORYPU
MGDGGGGGGLNVVVFPWLAARGHDVTFISTPRNVARLPPVPAGLFDRVRFAPLPMPLMDGLPEGAESTADVPPGNDKLIKKACDGLAAPFAAFMAELVPCAAFLIVQAAAIAFLGPRWANTKHPRAPLDFTAPPKWLLPPSAMAYRRSEARWVVGAFQPNASGVSDIERMWRTIESCRFTIYRSCDEVETGVLAFLTGLFRRPAVPAGILLTPPPDLAAVDGGSSGDRAETLRWLDEQPPKSVIYVALGSEAPVTEKNLQEARRPSRDPSDAPPDLAAVDGGSSGLVAREMAERGVGVEVAREDDDEGSFGRDAVAAAVRRVMVEDEGKVFGRNARKVNEAVGDQRRQEQYIDELVELLRTGVEINDEKYC